MPEAVEKDLTKSMNQVFRSLTKEEQTHCRRVGIFFAELIKSAQKLGLEMDSGFEQLSYAKLKKIPLYHDVGKSTLRRQGNSVDIGDCKESDIELGHPEEGVKIFESLTDFGAMSQEEVFFWTQVLDCIAEHHERYDRGGYPFRPDSSELSFAGAICAIADRLDHLLFREGNGVQNTMFEDACEEIRGMSGTWFDPAYVALFDKSVQQIEAAFLQIAPDGSVSVSKQNTKRPLELEFQPIYDLKQKRVVAFESLMRLHDRYYGTVSPGVFITVAEKSEQICALTEWAIFEACDAVVRMNEAGVPFQWITVNIAPKFLAKKSCMTLIRRALKDTRVPLEQISFEITEGAFFGEPEQVFENIKEIRAMGIRLYLDDFGTQYSSISRLNDIAFDCVKLDMGFIEKLLKDEKTYEIVKSVIEMAHKLHMKVVAEGIEEQPQADALMELGCDYLQGYLIGKPTPEGDVKRFF